MRFRSFFSVGGAALALFLVALCLGNAAQSHANETEETYQFETEISRMMHLIINSLYKNKEVFLREVISNASDAIDKVRLLLLTSGQSLDNEIEFRINVQADKEARLLHITDTGVGMTKQELITNLGTIAKSGTADFISKLQASAGSGDASQTANLIGQFGVGFYSVYLVADHVEVTTKSDSDEHQYIWSSNADSSYTIREDPAGNTLGRGTRITMHLKDDALSFLDEENLTSLIRRYSEFINYPIYVWTQAPPEPEAASKTEDEAEPSGEDDFVVEEEETAPEPPAASFVRVNVNKPLWLRPASEVTEEEYTEFYKSITKDTRAPMHHVHFSAEGDVDFKGLLYLPSKIPDDFYNEEPESVIRLFVRRVFITDEISDMLPRYLRFIRGIVDSDDLPLNVSRETLQMNRTMKLIKRKLTRKALDMFKEILEDEKLQRDFLRQYSQALKIGAIEDSANRKRIAQLLRFHTSRSKSSYRTLAEYVEGAKENQEHIYYMAGASLAEIKASPFLERILARGYEVLYLDEPIDEMVIQHLSEFDGKRFQNIAKDGFRFTDEDDDALSAHAALELEFEPLTAYLKKAYGSRVESVKLSSRLTKSPAVLVANEQGLSGNMERIMRSQTSGQGIQNELYFDQKRSFEVNPRHPVIRRMLELVPAADADDTSKAELEQVAHVLFDTALLRSGFTPKDTAGLANRIEAMIRTTISVSQDAQAEIVEEGPADGDLTEDDDFDPDEPGPNDFTYKLEL